MDCLEIPRQRRKGIDSAAVLPCWVVSLQKSSWSWKEERRLRFIHKDFPKLSPSLQHSQRLEYRLSRLYQVPESWISTHSTKDESPLLKRALRQVRRGTAEVHFFESGDSDYVGTSKRESCMEASTTTASSPQGSKGSLGKRFLYDSVAPRMC